MEIRVSTFKITNTTINKSIILNFEPIYYETIWFKIIVVSIFVFFVYLSFKIGKNVSKKKELVLITKVNERTAQLNKLVNELSISKNELTKSLKNKEILIKEVHHRLKNNLQLVISLLNIQSRAKEYKSIDKFLFEGQTRIKAMMLIHEKLYQNQFVESLDLKEYLISLYDTIYYTYKNDDSNINFKIKIDNVFLNLETAIPVGLIVNEILTNAMKYAFKENRGEILLECKKIGENQFKLIIKDNGIGSYYEKISKKSFGIELIHLLIQQLEGKINIVSNEGTCYEIIFNDKNISIL